MVCQHIPICNWGWGAFDLYLLGSIDGVSLVILIGSGKYYYMHESIMFFFVSRHTILPYNDCTYNDCTYYNDIWSVYIYRTENNWNGQSVIRIIFRCVCGNDISYIFWHTINVSKCTVRQLKCGKLHLLTGAVLDHY